MPKAQPDAGFRLVVHQILLQLLHDAHIVPNRNLQNPESHNLQEQSGALAPHPSWRYSVSTAAISTVQAEAPQPIARDRMPDPVLRPLPKVLAPLIGKRSWHAA